MFEELLIGFLAGLITAWKWKDGLELLKKARKKDA